MLDRLRRERHLSISPVLRHRSRLVSDRVAKLTPSLRLSRAIPADCAARDSIRFRPMETPGKGHLFLSPESRGVAARRCRSVARATAVHDAIRALGARSATWLSPAFHLCSHHVTEMNRRPNRVAGRIAIPAPAPPAKRLAKP
jgi:hypothetical protein